jgi:hypothetical protein
MKTGFLKVYWNAPVDLWAGMSGISLSVSNTENTCYDVAIRNSVTTRRQSCFVNKQTGVKELPALPNTIFIPNQELSFLLDADFHLVFTYTVANSPQTLLFLVHINLLVLVLVAVSHTLSPSLIRQFVCEWNNFPLFFLC